MIMTLHLNRAIDSRISSRDSLSVPGVFAHWDGFIKSMKLPELATLARIAYLGKKIDFARTMTPTEANKALGDDQSDLAHVPGEDQRIKDKRDEYNSVLTARRSSGSGSSRPPLHPGIPVGRRSLTFSNSHSNLAGRGSSTSLEEQLSDKAQRELEAQIKGGNWEGAVQTVQKWIEDSKTYSPRTQELARRAYLDLVNVYKANAGSAGEYLQRLTFAIKVC